MIQICHNIGFGADLGWILPIVTEYISSLVPNQVTNSRKNDHQCKLQVDLFSKFQEKAKVLLEIFTKKLFFVQKLILKQYNYDFLS